MAIVQIDGRELLDIVHDIEKQIAAKAGEADLAGKYDYLNIGDVLHPSRQLLGDPARPLLEYDGKVSILTDDVRFPTGLRPDCPVELCPHRWRVA